jgi:hypothetical protein
MFASGNHAHYPAIGFPWMAPADDLILFPLSNDPGNTC